MNYPIHLQEYLIQAAHLYPQKIAIICDKQRWSYQEINEKSNQFANALHEQGLKRGDRVVVCLENRVETVIAFWGVLKAGGIISIISPSLTREKMAYIVKDSGAKFLFSRLDRELFLNIKQLNCKLEKIVVLDESHELPDPLCSYEKFLSDNQSLPICEALDIDLAAIIYTSGSTGSPKGVMLTHRNMLAASISINSYLKLKHEDIIISALPLSFDYGLYQVILTFLNGASLVLEKDFIWPLQFLKKISQEKATVFPGVPTMFSILENNIHKSNYDISSIRCVTNTGASLLSKHINVIQKMFSNAIIFSMYGLTECKRCTYLPPEDIHLKPNSLGIAIPNTEMWIVGSEGQRLPAGEVGQLVIRGATVMKGYWNKAAQTEKVLRDGSLPNEKVLYTGDYGYMDDQGYFYFTGRIDEMIKSYGQKVSPKEIEDAIYCVPEVQELAVVAVPDEERGHAVIAYVVSPADRTQVSLRIQQMCKQKLEKSHWPKEVIFMDVLPKNPNGKLDKLALRNGYQPSAQVVNA